MNCTSVKSLLSEFTDERLDVSTAWQVQTHLSGCAECGQVRRDLEAVRQMVQTLPARQPSARFDDALAQRLSLTRRPAPPVRTWRTRLAEVFPRPAAAPRPASPALRLRPALALGLVIAAGSFAALYPARSIDPTPQSVVRSADPAFVADCVAQHHRDAAAEPLADLSAQSLAGSLDGSPLPDPPAAANPPSDSSTL